MTYRKPVCVRGHVNPKRYPSGDCIQCSRERPKLDPALRLERQRAYRARRRAEGGCLSCKAPALPGKSYCAVHRAGRAEVYRRRDAGRTEARRAAAPPKAPKTKTPSAPKPPRTKTADAARARQHRRAVKALAAMRRHLLPTPDEAEHLDVDAELEGLSP